MKCGLARCYRGGVAAVLCVLWCLVADLFLETDSCPSTSPSLASDHPQTFKKDVVQRAESYKSGLGGGVGAYTNSQGIPAVREVRHDSFLLSLPAFSFLDLPPVMAMIICRIDCGVTVLITHMTARRKKASTMRRQTVAINYRFTGAL